MSRNNKEIENFKKMIYSTMTAIATGIFISLFAISIYSFFSNSGISKIQAFFTVSVNILKSKISFFDSFSDNSLENLKDNEANIFSSQKNEIDIFKKEEGEEDPTFVSRFSRVIIYSNDDNREIIERAKKSLPRTGIKPVSAKGYMVLNMDSDTTILEKNIEKLMPIASLTKLVTAVMARKMADQDEFITINSKIASAYGNEAKFRLGEKFKIKELIYPLLMVSSNDAAEAIAQSHFLGRERFIKEMNDFVNSIGAYRTYFKDPSGLSPLNVSTAQDLAIITKWILENDPEIFEFTLTKSKTIRTHTWINPTHFLNLTVYAGGKNGYTTEANMTNISLFKLGQQKRLFAVIILGSVTRDNDILDLLDEAVR